MNYKPKFRDKLSLGFLAVIVFSLTLSLLSSVTLYNSRVTDEVTPRLLDSIKAINDGLDNVKDKALIYADIFNNNSAIANLIEDGSPQPTVIAELVKFGGKTDLDILQVTDHNGRVLGRMENTNLYNDDKRKDRLVSSALKGQKVSAIHEVDNNLSAVAGLPVKNNGRVIGTVTAGYKIANHLLRPFQNFAGEEIIVYHNNVLTASTISDLKIGSQTDETVALMLGKISPNNPYAIGTLTLLTKRYLAASAVIKGLAGREIGSLVSAVSLEPIISANNNTLYSLFIIFFFTIILALSFSTYLSTQMVKPIMQIQKGAEIVGAGNLSYELKIESGDEIEDVARSFNAMSAKLKEAFELTQQKVKQLEDQRNRLNLSAKLLLRRDLEVREVNEELEGEKWSISAEKNKLSLILSGIVDGVIALDLNRRVILFSQGAENLTGLTAKKALGKDIDSVIRIFGPLDQKINVSEFCPVDKEDISKDRILFQDQHLSIQVPSNRKEFFANVMSATIKESGAISLGCILTLHNVTAEHELEQMKVDFVSMAAHELRTPLTAISGYLYFLREEISASLNAEQKMYLERMVISTKQLQNLIDNLLDVAKIEKGNLTVEMRKENWETIVAEAVENYRGYAKEKKIKLALKISHQTLPTVKVDRFRIDEVLSNLLSNAVNFTSSGGEITVIVHGRKNEIITEVRDNGVGIPQEALPKLFTKFYRVSGVLGEGSKGTGLGLFISKAIVELHKGRIWVESTPGKGSSFYFSLPAQAGLPVIPQNTKML